MIALGLFISAASLKLSEAGGGTWLGLVSLLPLFAVIRYSLPARAAVYGAFWGACVWLFVKPSPDAGLFASFGGLVWTGATSGGFAFLASYLHHRLRLGAFHLALAWVLFEIALMPLDMGLGLLAATQQGSGFLDVAGRLFGYLLVAFVIAYFNALVLIVVVRLGAAVRNPVRADGIAGFTPFTSPQVSCPLPHPWFDVLARPPPRTCP